MLVTSVVFSASVDSSFASASLVLSSTTSVLSIVSVVSVSYTCADSTAVGMGSAVAVVSCFPQEANDKIHIVISAKIIFLFIVCSSLYKINYSSIPPHYSLSSIASGDFSSLLSHLVIDPF